ncbi:MAG: HEAT repeat domain-containing protein, partial [bacterium]|nr:HEAT repeat domain-containing protein [bacterium]
LESKSSLSLILASSSLSENFGSEVIDRRNKIPDADILWLIKILAERDDANVRYLAETANARKLLTPKRAFFLSIIENRQDLPTPVLRSLVKASLGIIKAEDISSFGRWYDNSIEEILLTLCSTETDPDVLYEVFDTVASKTLLDQLGGSLIEWVKKNYWDTRLEFIRSIGILALGEHSSKTEIQDALSIFDRYVADKELLGALMSADSTKVATSVIDRFREVIPVSNLLILLNDRDREVRLTAISALARSNDVGALRVILDGYEKENDQIVKKAYEEKFWVVKQRLVGKK